MSAPPPVFLRFVALLTIANSSACGDSVTLEQRAQPIVFNEREVDQPRGELLRAADATLDREHFQQRAYFRAHAANSVGTTFADPCGQGVEGGSATLSGPDRIVTAMHVFRDDPAGVSVRFGGASDGSGITIADASANVPYPDDTTYRFNFDEVNPLLANRLVSLSLVAWADANNGAAGVIRDLLRAGWVFHPETGSGSGATYYSQGFLTYSAATNVISGRDIVVLKRTSWTPRASAGLVPLTTTAWLAKIA